MYQLSTVSQILFAANGLFFNEPSAIKERFMTFLRLFYNIFSFVISKLLLIVLVSVLAEL